MLGVVENGAVQIQRQQLDGMVHNRMPPWFSFLIVHNFFPGQSRIRAMARPRNGVCASRAGGDTPDWRAAAFCPDTVPRTSSFLPPAPAPPWPPGAAADFLPAENPLQQPGIHGQPLHPQHEKSPPGGPLEQGGDQQGSARGQAAVPGSSPPTTGRARAVSVGAVSSTPLSHPGTPTAPPPAGSACPPWGGSGR